MTFRWTQPICGPCWDLRYPGREPVRTVFRIFELEQCCDCGAYTREGIYMRVDPSTVQFPTLTKS